MVKVALESKNAEVILARDGRQAIQLLREQPTFDLIITDIHMPHFNGDDILTLVRNEQQRNTPIIMISSDGEEEVIALALKQGVNDFIVKPVDATTLLKKIKPYLK